MTEVTEQGKTRAIIAHITLIGWIIAVVMNSEKKDEFASFYIRQVLGIFLIGIAATIVSMFLLFVVPFLSMIVSFGILALVILSLVWAINGEKRALPGVGDLFQDWFKSL